LCSVAIAFCLFVVVQPATAVRISTWGKPVPEFLQRPGLLGAYRIVAVVVIIVIGRLLFKALRAR
jgi:type IV secretory pathway VirB2 component (pilin)